MTALPICLVVVAGVGATMTSFLGRAVVEHNRILKEAATERAAWRSIGEIEVAKNVILNSTYTDGQNDAIQAALASDPPLIEGTPVVIESAGTGRWYRLSSSNDFGGASSSASCLLRDGLSYTAYNYYVEMHDLGVSGKPQGRIHTNKKLNLYGADGSYDGFVSAGEGFGFLAGATDMNTRFLRGSDQAAAPKGLLSKIDFAALKADADWVAPEGMVAEVTLLNTMLRVRLFEPDSVVLVPVEKTEEVQVGVELQLVEKTSYKSEWQWVSTRKSHKIWIENDGSGIGGGTDVGGGATTGYWKTEYYYEDVWTLVEVPDGTYVVPELVPIYETQTTTEYVSQTVAGAFVETVMRPADGIVYFPGTVRKLFGQLNGRLSLVTESSLKISGNIQYVDDDGDFAQLNGVNPAAGDYLPNPEFDRNHALGVIAQGDILYARAAPTNLEINAALVSTTGKISMEGISIDADGKPSKVGATSLKSSLRRLGSILSAKRPVATLLDNGGTVIHGFQTGSSLYDAGALVDPPPGFPSEEELQCLDTVRRDPADSFPEGEVEDAPGVVPLTSLKSYAEIRLLSTRVRFDWGVIDLKQSFIDVDLSLTGGRHGGAGINKVLAPEDP